MRFSVFIDKETNEETNKTTECKIRFIELRFVQYQILWIILQKRFMKILHLLSKQICEGKCKREGFHRSKHVHEEKAKISNCVNIC